MRAGRAYGSVRVVHEYSGERPLFFSGLFSFFFLVVVVVVLLSVAHMRAAGAGDDVANGTKAKNDEKPLFLRSFNGFVV